MAARRSGLGRGLDALISDKVGAKDAQTSSEPVKTAKKKTGKSTKSSKNKAAKKKESNKVIAVEELQENPAAVDDVYNKEENDSHNDVQNLSTESVDTLQSAENEENPQITEQKADEIPINAEDNHVLMNESEQTNAESEENEPQVDTAADFQNHVVNMETTFSKSESNHESVVEMKISLVEPNREQPRKTFNDETIEELADSVRQYGIIQPLLVQKADGYYQIIAGERRWRAARKAGLKTVPVIIKDFSTQTAVEVSLIENIQREDLNPMEEAKAYERLVEDYSLTQEEVAEKVSKNRSTVANSMRLLKLSPEVQGYVADGSVTEGHARALLGISDPEVQKQIADQIIQNHLNVREAEKIVRSLSVGKKRKRSEKDSTREAVLNSLSEQLKNVFGTKVAIHQGRKNRGKIEIEYYSEEELDRIFELLSSIRGTGEDE